MKDVKKIELIDGQYILKIGGVFPFAQSHNSSEITKIKIYHSIDNDVGTITIDVSYIENKEVHYKTIHYNGVFIVVCD